MFASFENICWILSQYSEEALVESDDEVAEADYYVAKASKKKEKKKQEREAQKQVDYFLDFPLHFSGLSMLLLRHWHIFY